MKYRFWQAECGDDQKLIDSVSGEIKLSHFSNTLVPRNPGRFGPGSFRPESFRPGSFRPILGVGRFGLGRWVVSANFLGESIRPKYMEIFR